MCKIVTYQELKDALRIPEIPKPGDFEGSSGNYKNISYERVMNDRTILARLRVKINRGKYGR